MQKWNHSVEFFSPQIPDFRKQIPSHVCLWQRRHFYIVKRYYGLCRWCQTFPHTETTIQHISHASRSLPSPNHHLGGVELGPPACSASAWKDRNQALSACDTLQKEHIKTTFVWENYKILRSQNSLIRITRAIMRIHTIILHTQTLWKRHWNLIL